MSRYPCLCAALALLPLAAVCQERDSGDALPVRRVVLYKNGVGYFEHVGSVRGNQQVTVPLSSGQLNDVLKSLTVLDLSGGRITGVAYDSAAPMDKQLGELHLPGNEKASLTEFLASFRGAKLEIRSGASVMTGRLLSVERKTRIAGGTTLEVDYLALITDTGEIRTTELAPSFSVKLLEKPLAAKLERFLDVVSSGRESDIRRMTISTQGNGERSLFVSYISEVPVWKATYRIVLSAKGPLLQGWAIVDNTVGQNWDNVQLSLVAGAPQSFVQNLSQPYYSRRPVVALPQNAMASPQTHEATLIPGSARLAGIITDPSGTGVGNATVKAYDLMGQLAGEATADSSGRYEFASLPDGSVRLEIESPGFSHTTIRGVEISAGRAARQDARLQLGSVTQTVVVRAQPAMIDTESASISGVSGRDTGSGAALGGRTGSATGRGSGVGSGGGIGPGVADIADARRQSQAAANAQDLGDLFEYKLKEPITIQKNRSALVPIVQSGIGAEKISIWNDSAGLPRPQRALWLTNTSGLTLEGGSFSVMEEETFAGEGVFDPIRPDEKRLVSYASDLALNASSRNSTEQQRVSSVRIIQGLMFQASEIREKKTYTFRNEDTSPRTVLVEHPVRAGYVLRSDARPVETTADWMRFRLQVGPKQTASLLVEEAKPQQAIFTISELTADRLALFVRQRSIDATVEQALRRVVAQKAVIDAIAGKSSALDDERDKIFDDQQRLRENMKALKGTPEEKSLVQRYTQQLNQQEDRLASLKKEIAELEKQSEAAHAELEKIIQSLMFDVKL